MSDNAQSANHVALPGDNAHSCLVLAKVNFQAAHLVAFANPSSPFSFPSFCQLLSSR
jgi:hypothetical protein